MMRVGLVAAAAIALSACLPMDQAQTAANEPQNAEVERAAVDAIAGAYLLTRAESSAENCRVTLNATPEGHVGAFTTRAMSMDTCHVHFPSLAAARQWAWTGGGSISFYGGNPTHEVSHFSPVQDATGVFLRGGFAGDNAVYELHQADQ